MCDLLTLALRDDSGEWWLATCLAAAASLQQSAAAACPVLVLELFRRVSATLQQCRSATAPAVPPLAPPRGDAATEAAPTNSQRRPREAGLCAARPRPGGGRRGRARAARRRRRPRRGGRAPGERGGPRCCCCCCQPACLRGRVRACRSARGAGERSCRLGRPAALSPSQLARKRARSPACSLCSLASLLAGLLAGALVLPTGLALARSARPVGRVVA